MRIIERYTSPDGQLLLTVAVGNDGDVAVGFEGGDWHTHPDLLSQWLSVLQKDAVTEFIKLLRSDQLPILMSTDGGETIAPWVSDNLDETLRIYGHEQCLLRYWSGKNPQL